MDAKEIQRRVERVKADIEKEVRDWLPRKVGITAGRTSATPDGGTTDCTRGKKL